jgi:hypothetical protein
LRIGHDKVRQSGKQQVEPFLPRQPADDAEQHRFRLSASPKRACRARLFNARRRGLFAEKRAGRCTSVAGFQTSVSMRSECRVDCGPRLQETFKTHAEFRAGGLGRIGG